MGGLAFPVAAEGGGYPMRKYFGIYNSTVSVGIGKILCGLFLALLLCTEDVSAKTYFLSPSGTDSNSGTDMQFPWLTFAHAQSNGWGCGDTLMLLDGTYGDGSSTGKPTILNTTCTVGNEMVLKALNERRAHIHDNGLGMAVLIVQSHYITISGLRLSSSVNATPYLPLPNKCTVGIPVHVSKISTHISVLKSLIHTPNKYCNSSPLTFDYVNDSLVEDTEIYDFHRHGAGISGYRDTVRRLYCNERDGGINGGYNNRVGGGDACVSAYPCVDCIVENVIADASTAVGHFLSESNAAGNSTSTRYLGSIGYRNNPHGVYVNARGTGILWMPVNNTFRDMVFYDHLGSTAIRSESAKGTVVDHVTVIGSLTSPPTNGIFAKAGAFPGDGIYSATVTNSLVLNHSQYGFYMGISTWSGSHVRAYNNRLGGFYPAPPSYWTNVSTVINPAMGSCVVWVPDGSPLKGAGSDGTDIGATILYRYVNGTLTNQPLWDPVTGEFPHGAIVSGVNDVPGHSLFDVHRRLNVNTNGCSFPTSYGKNIDTTAPQPPQNVAVR
jgi:hypothetical protein